MTIFDITALYLKDNYIEKEGPKALAKVLRHNNSVIHVDLSHNRIRDEGAQAICKKYVRCLK